MFCLNLLKERSRRLARKGVLTRAWFSPACCVESRVDNSLHTASLRNVAF